MKSVHEYPNDFANVCFYLLLAKAAQGVFKNSPSGFSLIDSSAVFEVEKPESDPSKLHLMKS